MNAIGHPNIYMRSLATRDTGSEISRALPDVIAACRSPVFDLVVVEHRASARATRPSCRWSMSRSTS